MREKKLNTTDLMGAFSKICTRGHITFLSRNRVIRFRSRITCLKSLQMHRLEKKKKERKITLSLIMFKLSQKTSFYRRDVVKKEGEDFLLFFQTKQRSQ